VSEFGPGGAWGDWDAETGEMDQTAGEQLANSQAVSEVVADAFGPGGASGMTTEGGEYVSPSEQLANIGLDPGDIQSRVGQAFGGEGDPGDPDPAGDGTAYTVPNPPDSLPSLSSVAGVMLAALAAAVGYVVLLGGD